MWVKTVDLGKINFHISTYSTVHSGTLLGTKNSVIQTKGGDKVHIVNNSLKVLVRYGKVGCQVACL